MDKDTRLTLVDIVEVSQATMQSASEARILSLRIHDALLKACVPGYLEAYESGDDNLVGELTSVKNKLSRLIAAGIQKLRRATIRPTD
jgi:hypothetical protein